MSAESSAGSLKEHQLYAGELRSLSRLSQQHPSLNRLMAESFLGLETEALKRMVGKFYSCSLLNYDMIPYVNALAISDPDDERGYIPWL